MLILAISSEKRMSLAFLAKVSNISLGTREKCPVQCQGQGPAGEWLVGSISGYPLQLAPCV